MDEFKIRFPDAVIEGLDVILPQERIDTLKTMFDDLKDFYALIKGRKRKKVYVIHQMKESDVLLKTFAKMAGIIGQLDDATEKLISALTRAS